MGKKRYYQQDRVGSSKYTISYHDGKKKHKDGSDFFDIQTFKNKKDLAKFVNILHKGGYVYGFNESAKRDYKDEYKKFQSSTKSKKYRAELNKYNRDKGTYGNGDGKDASHKGGKIVGFESASKNRGRAEKSRLKKESVNEAKSEIKVLVKKVGKSEIKFYDVLDTMEKKYGKRKYRIWLEKSLKDFGVNPKHYDYRTNAAAEEKLFQLGK